MKVIIYAERVGCDRYYVLFRLDGPRKDEAGGDGVGVKVIVNQR